jgi:LCCL domain-containing protein
MWNRSRHNGCGINGDSCRPFDNATFAFRCPASCIKAKILEPYAVGDEMINYRPLVIGGPMEDNADSYADSIYRGDSFICATAIHSGYLSDEKGGCGVLRLVGERSSYPATSRHGIKSIGFNSYFPQSFGFVKDTTATCEDLRWPLLAVSVTYSVLISLFTTSAAVFFWTIFSGLFIHVALVSDPPGFSNYHSLISTAVGRFLPAAFCMAIMYFAAIRFTLKDLKAQVEKTVLWLGACWVGSLNNYTFDKIPIQRLTPHDLQQPGAITALMIIILTLLSIALSQAWFIRIEGLMPKYLAIYGIFCGTLILLAIIPVLSVRIHHYILALLLLPGTRLQMRPSLLYQGLLVGFFINGIARWGFDSLLQTEYELRGDAPLGSDLPFILPPTIHPNLGTGLPSNITFDWNMSMNEYEYDGVSVLVNDVERFKGYRDQGVTTFTWRRTRVGSPEYFRFGFLTGGNVGDYTRAGVWDVDLSWRQMEPGPSK